MRMNQAKTLLLFSLFLSLIISCNSPKDLIDKEDFTILKSIKTPISGGAGNRGMKIQINVKILNDIKFDSIIYNKRSGVIDIVKDQTNSIWLVSHFYNEEKIIKGKSTIKYTAEGDTCEVFYTLNKKVKKVIISDLTLKQENVLWE